MGTGGNLWCRKKHPKVEDESIIMQNWISNNCTSQFLPAPHQFLCTELLFKMIKMSLLNDQNNLRCK